MFKCHFRHWLADAKLNTLAEAIKRTGLERRTLMKLRDEVGLETVSLDTLRKVCDAFQRPLSELIEYVPKKE